MLHGPKKTQDFARHLRRQLTLPEVLLWQALRTGPAGLRFRRQHPAGIYVLDFFCPAAKLAVEVDGEAHARGDRPERDAMRDSWLRAQGVRVLRIPAQVVLSDLEVAIRYIIVVARGDYPSTGFAGPQRRSIVPPARSWIAGGNPTRRSLRGRNEHGSQNPLLGRRQPVRNFVFWWKADSRLSDIAAGLVGGDAFDAGVEVKGHLTPHAGERALARLIVCEKHFVAVVSV
ncbi:endonuclease domain-containing protein [Sphingomonas sp. CJ20]